MKKKFAFCLMIVLCLCCLASCRSSYQKSAFFSDELLSPKKLTDMPVPPGVDHSVIQNGGYLYLNITKDAYRQYVDDLLDYLRTKEDIYYLGYYISSALQGEIMPYSNIAPITEDYDTSGNDHQFFFSTEDGLDKWDMLKSPVQIRITRETGKLKFDGFEYNTKIKIVGGYNASASWNQCAAGHTYDDGMAYPIAGSDKTITQYTCVHCAEQEYSDFIGDMKIYRITIEDTDADHYIINRRDEAVSGVIIGFKTPKLIDADLKFVVNGTVIQPRETEDDKWIYEFVMPCADIVITTEIVT